MTIFKFSSPFREAVMAINSNSTDKHVDVIIVDDEKASFDVISRYLDYKTSLKVELHTEALYALSLIKTRKPALVIVNLLAKRFDALSIVKSITTNEDSQNIPVVVISDPDAPERIKQAIQNGAKDFVHFPISIVSLSKKLSKFLNFDVSELGKHTAKLEARVANNFLVVEVEGYLLCEQLFDFNVEVLRASELFDGYATKRILVIFYNIETESFTYDNIALLFDFFSTIPIESTDYLKILTDKEEIKSILKRHDRTSKFEFVNDYIDGINKLELATLNRELGIKIEFLKPGITLTADLFDINGRRLKNAYEVLNESDIHNFKIERIERVFYEADLKKLDENFTNSDNIQQMRINKALDTVNPVNSRLIEDNSGAFGFLKNKTILLIEDDQAILDMLSTFLASKGFNVISSINSNSALDIALQKKPDLIITDLMMPYIDGLQLVERINKALKKNRPPVILITCAPTNENVIKARELGINGFIPKPIDFKNLFVKVAMEIKKAINSRITR